MLELFEQPVQWSHLRSGSLDLMTAQAYHQDAPQAHAIWLDDQRQPQARCSLWWMDTPSHLGKRVGTIGHYVSIDQACGRQLILDSCKILQKAGCQLAVGPMDGSTWRNYRLITGGVPTDRFLFEPNHPSQYADHFTSAGFSVMARYHSAVCDHLAQRDRRADRVADKLVNSGIKIRALNPLELQSDLKAIYDVTIDAFREAFLFYPIAFESFLKQVQPLVESVDPQWILLAQHGYEVVGFVFGTPDLLQARTAQGSESPMPVVDTAILKTLAVRPRRSLAGLGMLLLQQFHDLARDQGFSRVIHALMHDKNGFSCSLSSRFTKPIRSYALFAKELC
jgi:GNAT superfamily N-acetyltransferase